MLRKDAIKDLFNVYRIKKDTESDPGVKAAAARRPHDSSV
jgi:hypothetical protein